MMMGLITQLGQLITGQQRPDILDYGPTFPNTLQTDDVELHMSPRNTEETIMFSNLIGTDDDDDEVEETEEEIQTRRARIVQTCVAWIETHLGRPPKYDSDLVCNLICDQEHATWHVPVQHVFIDILLAHSRANNGDGRPLLFERSRYQAFFVYRNQDIVDLVRDMTFWFSEYGIYLKTTSRFEIVQEKDDDTNV